jgi:hypothetical protein
MRRSPGNALGDELWHYRFYPQSCFFLQGVNQSSGSPVLTMWTPPRCPLRPGPLVPPSPQAKGLVASLSESGMDAKAFPPALAESMDVAFKRVCKSLGAKPGHEIATRAAAKIVELVKAGVSDPDELYSAC